MLLVVSTSCVQPAAAAWHAMCAPVAVHKAVLGMPHDKILQYLSMRSASTLIVLLSLGVPAQLTRHSSAEQQQSLCA